MCVSSINCCPLWFFNHSFAAVTTRPAFFIERVNFIHSNLPPPTQPTAEARIACGRLLAFDRSSHSTFVSRVRAPFCARAPQHKSRIAHLSGTQRAHVHTCTLNLSSRLVCGARTKANTRERDCVVVYFIMFSIRRRASGFWGAGEGRQRR